MNEQALIKNIARQISRNYIRLSSRPTVLATELPNGGMSYSNSAKLLDGGLSGSTYSSTNYDGGNA